MTFQAIVDVDRNFKPIRHDSASCMALDMTFLNNE